MTSASVVAPPAVAQDESGGEQRTIREVRVTVEQIYTEEEASESSWKKTMDRYHTPTRDSVIRREVLFREGDVLDAQLLAESERKLRRFKFLNKASIKVVPVDEQTVDVEIFAKDAWSLEPGVNFEGGGGLATVSAHLIDFNLLGLGKKLYGEGIYENDVGTTWKFGYSDYQLLNSRWKGNVVYANGPLVESFFAQARMPLYSPDSVWSYGGSAYKADRIVRLFEDGAEVSRIGKDQSQLSASTTRAFGERFQKWKLTFKLKYLKADYFSLGAETTTPPPPDQENLTPSVAVSKENIGFVRTTFVNKMGYVEDGWKGRRYGGKVGYGIPLGDGFELWDTQAHYTQHAELPKDQLLLFNTAVASEIKRNTFFNLAAKYYKKFSRHTVATRFTTSLGYELDTSRQFQLGGDSGLRGYPARAFTGDRLMLLNLEDRQFWGEFQLGPKIAFGTVVFVDAGNVWDRDESIAMSDLNWSAGVGVRIGMSNLPKQPILRIDIGYGFADDDYAVTIGPEQQF